jgi:HEAT repeat protein
MSALKGIAKGDASVEYALIEFLKTGDPFSKGLAAKALGDMKANRATEALATVLSDGSAMASEMAASALREIGPPAEAAVPALVSAARKNKDAYLAKLCVQALTAIGTPQAKEAIRQLEAGK